MNNKFWGGKYNWAVKKLMLDYAFNNVNTVLFHIGETNYRSQKAVSKLGAKKREGVIMDFNGRESAHFEYELLSKDWLTKS